MVLSCFPFMPLCIIGMDNVCNVPLQVFSFLHFHRRYRPAAFVVFSAGRSLLQKRTSESPNRVFSLVLEPTHKKEALFSIKKSKIKYILRSGICHS